MTTESPKPPLAPLAPSPAAAPRASRGSLIRRTLLIAGPVAVLVGGVYFYATGGRYVETDNAYVKADRVAVSAEIAGPIAAVDVHENQHVEAGQVLFRIDRQPFRIALEKAEAQLETTRADLESQKAAYRQIEEQVKMARSNAAYAQEDFQRQSELMKANVAARTRYDESRHNLDTARQQIAVLDQQSAQILARIGGRADVVAERYPAYMQAKAAVDQARLDLARTEVHAPLSGVASRVPQPGDFARIGVPSLSIVNDSGAWIEANFKETDLAYVQPGLRVRVWIDAYPDEERTGQVTSISPATGSEFSILPAQNATGNWVKVVQRIPLRVALDDLPGARPIRAGMSATVEIDTQHQRKMPALIGSVLAWTGAVPAQ